MIELKKFREDDIPSFLNLLEGTDAVFLVQFAGSNYIYPLNKEQLLVSIKDKSCILFKVIEKENGEVIGHCQFLRIDRKEKTATIGRVLLNPEKRGFGYGLEIIKQLVEYGKNELDLVRIELNVFEFNHSAYKCYLKFGFVETERELKTFEKINKTWNCISMEYI